MYMNIVYMRTAPCFCYYSGTLKRFFITEGCRSFILYFCLVFRCCSNCFDEERVRQRYEAANFHHG